MTRLKREEKYWTRVMREWSRMNRRQRKKVMARDCKLDRCERQRLKGDHRNWWRRGAWLAMPEEKRHMMSCLVAGAGILGVNYLLASQRAA